MKKLNLFLLVVVLATSAAHSQVLVYDQESSSDETYSSGGAVIQFYGTVGQSFTPSLSSVGFIRVKFFDTAPGNTIGATLVMNLRANAINGPIIGTASPLVLSNGFAGSANFLFPTAVPVTPNLTYFFETTVQSGDNWTIRTLGDTYPTGSFYGGGFPATGNDLWFREGIVVPEPTSALLLFLGSGLVSWFAARKRRSV